MPAIGTRHLGSVFVNIHDVVDANLLVLHDERADYEVFNVGGGKPMSVLEFARTAAEVYGYDDYEPRPSGKYRFGDTRHICSDVTKLEFLGWKPTRDVRESVEEYKAWLDESVLAPEILEHCNQQMAELDVVREVAV